MAITLSFGTAGIRARLGTGDDELNVRSVRVVGQALFEYVGALDDEARQRGVCIGYDGRAWSREFAQELSAVAIAHGFSVRAFEDTVATPLLAFSTQLHQAALGLMVTASHNPASDNGIKVYWRGGAQILPPHDAEIARRIGRVSDDSGIARADLIAARERGQLRSLGEHEQNAYLDAIVGLLPPNAARAPEGALRPAPGDDLADLPAVAYSALCGVGSAVTHALTVRTGVDLISVPSQALPRPDFGGLSSPNPEHRAALTEVLALAERNHAPLAFCHDPDADRLAVAARDALGTLRVLSGDEVGALLTDYLLSLEPEPQHVAVISTLVSGGLAECIARSRGAHFERTLTGFKWITAQGRKLERESGLRYLFGYEEALGYCFGALGDDKDGIAALHVLTQLARRLQNAGHGLWDRLEQLAREHALFCARQVTVSASGVEGGARMGRLLGELRRQAPATWLNQPAVREDYLERAEHADLLVFRVPAKGARICVRPSGTEAKLKFYLEASERVETSEPCQDARTRAERTLDELAERVRVLNDGCI